MCKVIATIEEKKAMLDALQDVIERINNDISHSKQMVKEEADLLDELRADPENNKYDMQWRAQNIDEYNNKISALEAIKKHLEKLI